MIWPGPALVITSLERELPAAAVAPLRCLLVGLRTRRLSPEEFWAGWDTLPVEDPTSLAPLRALAEVYLHWREIPTMHGFTGTMVGRWATEHPLRAHSRSQVERVMRYQDRRARRVEVAPAPAPGGSGEEASPA